jgi:hypothetical protein
VDISPLTASQVPPDVHTTWVLHPLAGGAHDWAGDSSGGKWNMCLLYIAEDAEQAHISP